MGAASLDDAVNWVGDVKLSNPFVWLSVLILIGSIWGAIDKRRSVVKRLVITAALLVSAPAFADNKFDEPGGGAPPPTLEWKDFTVIARPKARSPDMCSLTLQELGIARYAAGWLQDSERAARKPVVDALITECRKETLTDLQHLNVPKSYGFIDKAKRLLIYPCDGNTVCYEDLP